MPMGYEQFKPPQNNLNAPKSGRIKIESEDFLMGMGLYFEESSS
jgi:hypothetical protein